MVGDKYVLEPEAILDHCVAAEGKRWYLVKWKPKWVKKHQLPEGVFEKWEEKKAKRAKLLAENPEAEPEAEEEETGFRILEERRVIPGQETEDDDDEKAVNGDEEDDEDEDDYEGEDGDEDEEDEEELDEDEEDEDEEEGMEDEEDEEEEEEKYNVDVKEEPEDGEYTGQNGLNISDDEDANMLSSIDRDIVLNELPGEGEVKEEAEIKEEEDKISIPTDYSKPYS